MNSFRNLASITFLLVILWTLETFPQTLQLRTYGPLEGLPQSEIVDVFQDHYGYMWFGTNESGVVRYNGHSMKVYSREQGLAHPSVRAIWEDHLGNIWAGTEGGLCRIARNDSIVSFTKRHGLPSVLVRALTGDQAGHIWIGTNAGLARMDRSAIGKPPDETAAQISSFTWSVDADESDVWALEITGDRYIWIGTNGGLFVADIQNLTGAQPEFDKVLEVPIRSLCQGPDMDLLVGSIAGLYRIDGARPDAPPEVAGLTDTRIYGIDYDANNVLWVGTWEYLARFQNGEFVKYDTENGLPNRYVRSLFIDYEDNIWLGTFGGGIAVIYGRYIENYTQHNGLPVNTVFSLLQDRSGRVWVGTNGGGIARIENGRMAIIDDRNGLPNNVIRGMTQTADGRIWVATHEGIGVYDRGRWQKIMREDGLPFELLASVYSDPSDGSLWFGTFGGGAIRYRNGEFKNDVTRDTLPSTNVYQVLRDRKSRLWIATKSGLYLEEEGQSRVFDESNGLPDSTITCLYEDQQGAIWIGTRQGGAARFEGGKFEVINTASGLPTNLVYFIIEDAQKRIWLGTSSGLACYDGQEMQVVRATHGLAADECNTRAAVIDDDDHLWLGTVGGVSRLDASRFPPTAPAPKVEIFSIEAGQETYTAHDDLSLTKNFGTSFYFHFGALSFISEKETTYQVKLEGFDDDWLNLKDERSIRYTNLDPAEYVFKVKATNALGIESSETATASIRVLPPFYRTPWFIITGLLILGGVIYGLHRLKLRNVQTRSKLLESAVREKASELQDALSFLEIVKEFLPIGLLVVDPDRFIVDANQAAEDLFGYSRSEIRGNEIHNFLSSPILSRNELWKRLHSNKKARIELIGHHKDGKRFVCQAHSDYYQDSTRNISYLILTCEDIEDKKMLEARLIESEKQLALSDLLAGMGDVLNNRLSGLHGYMEVLKGELNKTGQADPNKVIKWVQESVQDISKILKELIECSAYLVKVPVVASDLRSDLKTLARRWEDKIKIQLPEMNEPLNLKLVPKFRSGLDEVILNSLDAGASVVKFEVSVIKHASQVKLEITDNGRGLQPESINKVFLPFFKTKSTPHSGLGLWKLYQVVKQCGGSVEIFALQHGGTQLRIILPLATNEPAPASKDRTRNPKESESV